MNRRRFLGLLACLPFVRVPVDPFPVGTKLLFEPPVPVGWTPDLEIYGKVLATYQEPLIDAFFAPNPVWERLRSKEPVVMRG